MALLLNSGRAIKTNLLSGLGGTAPTYIGWGTSSAAESASQTGLQAASAEARTNCTMTRQTTSVTNDTVQWVGTITSASGQTIQEIALYDAVSSGNGYMRALTGGQALNINDSMTFTVKEQIS